MKRFPGLGSWWGLSILLGITLGCALWHVHAIVRDLGVTRSDLLPRIVGTRDALRGIDPYSPEALRDIRTQSYRPGEARAAKSGPMRFYYPATLVVVLAPLAQLSWGAIEAGFEAIVPVLLAVSALVWIRLLGLELSAKRTVAAVGLFVCSWPAIWGLYLQQPTLVIAVAMAAVALGLARRADLAAGAGLALCTVKPQLALPLLLWLVMWAAWHRRWRFLAGFAIGMAALLGAAEWMVPHWFPHWIGDLRGYSGIAVPALQMMAGRWLGLGALGALCLWSGWNLLRLLERGGEAQGLVEAMALVMALTVVAAPTTYPLIYNQVLLLPAVLLLAFSPAEGEMAALFGRVALLFVLYEYGAVVVAVAGESVWRQFPVWHTLPFLNLLLPVAVVVALNLMLAHGRAGLAVQAGAACAAVGQSGQGEQ